MTAATRTAGNDALTERNGIRDTHPAMKSKPWRKHWSHDPIVNAAVQTLYHLQGIHESDPDGNFMGHRIAQIITAAVYEAHPDRA